MSAGEIFVRDADKRIAELEARIDELAKIIEAYDDIAETILYRGTIPDTTRRVLLALRPALAAEEEPTERCPYLAGDVCVKEGKCECYGAAEEGEKESVEEQTGLRFADVSVETMATATIDSQHKEQVITRVRLEFNLWAPKSTAPSRRSGGST